MTLSQFRWRAGETLLLWGARLHEGPGQDVVAAIVDEIAPGCTVRMPSRFIEEPLPEVSYLDFELVGTPPEIRSTLP